MEPSKKSEQVTDAIDAFSKSVFGRTRTEAIRDNLCVMCGAKIESFRDDASKREYAISGMCQTCQDSVFGE